MSALSEPVSSCAIEYRYSVSIKLLNAFLSITASFMCSVSIVSEPLMSAIVLASFRQLAVALGEKLNFSAELFKNDCVSEEVLHNPAISAGVRCAFFLP